MSKQISDIDWGKFQMRLQSRLIGAKVEGLSERITEVLGDYGLVAGPGNEGWENLLREGDSLVMDARLTNGRVEIRIPLNTKRVHAVYSANVRIHPNPAFFDGIEREIKDFLVLSSHAGSGHNLDPSDLVLAVDPILERNHFYGRGEDSQTVLDDSLVYHLTYRGRASAMFDLIILRIEERWECKLARFFVD